MVLLACLSLHLTWELLTRCLLHSQTFFRFELNLCYEPQPYLKRVPQLTDNSLRVSFDRVSSELWNNECCQGMIMIMLVIPDT